MSSYIAGSLIGAGAALAGGVFATLRDSRLRKEQRIATNRRELRQAMQGYLAALDAIMLEAADFPAPSHMTRVDRWIDRMLIRVMGPLAPFIATRLINRLVYGLRHDELSDRLVAAAAQLRLVAPPAIEEYMREAEMLAREHRGGSEQWRERWKAFRLRMRQGFREALDNP
jgi:hypothetical protein